MIHFDIAGTLKEIEELEEKSAAPDFWEDMENSQKVLQKTKQLKDKVSRYNGLKTAWEDALTLIELANEENDESMLPEITEQVLAVEKELETITLETLLSGP